MPVVTLNMWDEVLNEETEPALIGALTEALVEVMGEQIRPHTVVLLQGYPQRRWGVAGVPTSESAPLGGEE